MKELKEYMRESLAEEATDVALVGDIIMYSSRNSAFSDRKQAIVDAFCGRNASAKLCGDYIIATPIFGYYVRDIVDAYKKDINNEANLNVSTDAELRRQLANDIIAMVRGIEPNSL